MKKKTDYKLYIFNATLTICLFLFICYNVKNYHFSNNTFGTSDGLAQFKPMLFDVITKIKMGIFSNYSFNNGLGNPSIFNILYYVSSPINIFAFLFKKPENMYFYVLVVKILITSLCVTKYSLSKTKNKFAIIIANIAYCFSSYFLTYYYYSTFIDVFMIFPLFQYGLEQLLDNNKEGCYIFSLTYMFISNFYLSFAVCIYTLIYFFIKEILYKKNSNKDKINSFLNISKSTILVFLLSFFWIYMLYDSYKRMNLSFDNDFDYSYFTTITNFISSIFYGQNILDVSSDGEIVPNIASNIIILISFIYYFFNNKINKRTRFYVFIGFLLTMDFMLLPKLDYILNFFHNIRGLPYRYSFIPIFLSIILFLENSNNIDLKNKTTRIKIFVSIIIASILFISLYNNLRTITKINFIMMSSIIFVWILFYNNSKTIKYLLVVSIIFEVIIISPFSTLNYGSKAEKIDVNNYKTIARRYREYGGTKLCESKKISTNFWHNCNLYDNSSFMTLFTSMTYNKAIKMLNKYGVGTGQNTTIFPEEYNQNEFVKMIFNIKGDYYLEKIYSVSSNIKNIKLSDDFAKNQNNTIKSLTNVEEIISLDEELTNNYNHFKPRCKNKEFDLICKKKKEYKLYPRSEQLNSKVYIYDIEKLKQAHNVLKKNQIEYTYYSDSKIEGIINVDKNQLIFTSIPYDTNWDVYIDGKKVKAIKILDSLLGIETKEGKHKIKLEYKEHFTIPFLISLTTLILLIINKYKKKA